MHLKKDEVSIRRMRDDIEDYSLMAKWLTDEKVLKYYEGRDNPFPLDRIIESYQPQVRGDDNSVPCFFYYQKTPIGYLQYYALNDLPDTDRQMYCLEKTEDVYAIDLFIGETQYWNQGIGTKVVSLALDYIFEQLQAVKVVIDPQVWNTRAIRCYEKCGFVKVKILPEHELHEGKYWDCWLMATNHNKSVH
ncbi:acetyltransferase [Scytonema tolypothrichoides VB-61278]|nr:acetyltransferase [Scytonema tolypothrichoides VB-61278]